MTGLGRHLVLAVVGLAVLGGGGWLVYRVVGVGPPAEVPLIRAEPGPIKTRPEKPGGLEVPNQDKLVYRVVGDDGGKAVAERLLPPPEEPLPAMVAPPPPEAKAPPAPAPAEPAAAPEAPAPPSPPPTKPVRAATPAVASTSSAKSKGVLIQLAAFKKAGEATAAWARIHKANRDLLGDLTPAVVRVDLGGGKGVFFRLRAGPFASLAGARTLCAKLKVRKLECIVVGE